MSTYYIIKASNVSLKDAYLILHMKEHYQTPQEAQNILDNADPDIIPPGSQIYHVIEDIQEIKGDLVVSIGLTPVI